MEWQPPKDQHLFYILHRVQTETGPCHIDNLKESLRKFYYFVYRRENISNNTKILKYVFSL